MPSGGKLGDNLKLIEIQKQVVENYQKLNLSGLTCGINQSIPKDAAAKPATGNSYLGWLTEPLTDHYQFYYTLIRIANFKKMKIRDLLDELI